MTPLKKKTIKVKAVRPKVRVKARAKPKATKKQKKSPKRAASAKPSHLLLGLSAAAAALCIGIGLICIKASQPAPQLIVERVQPLATEFDQASKLPISERVSYWSRLLWTSPDAHSALRQLVADAPRISDSAPLVPPKFNCTTFVETVLALAHSAAPDGFLRNLLAIRYRNSIPNFVNRNHFPEADWIPNNARAGLLVDITGAVARTGGVQTGLETKMIRRGEWLARQIQGRKVERSIASAIDDDWSTPVQVGVRYIPLKDVAAIAGRIPNGSVMNLVRRDNGRQFVLITHQGIVVQENGTTVFRHALPDGHIYNVPLVHYLNGIAGRGAAGWRARPPVIGININQLNGPT